MSARTFFDTNVVAYSLNSVDPRKALVAKTILRRAVQDSSAILSYQVLQELFHIGFRKFQPPMTPDEARTYLDDVANGFEIVPWSAGLVRRAIAVREKYLFSWYDSLIVAAALESKCDALYTEDLQHGQRIEGLRVVNPFL